MTQSHFFFHLEPWAQDQESFFSSINHSHFFSIQSLKRMTQSRFSHLWPKVSSFPFRFLSSWPIVVFSHLWPRVISFPFRTLFSWSIVVFLIYDLESFCFGFRALNSRPIVVFLIYNPESFHYHLDFGSHVLESLSLWSPRVSSFPFRALSSGPRVVVSQLWPRVISFPFRALSSRPRVVFLIYEPEYFVFHSEL